MSSTSTRPRDWWVLDLGDDPTPGSPAAVRRMARRWSEVADDAAWGAHRMRQLMDDEALGRWVGEAGDAFREKTGDLPDQLSRCADSYGQAADALSWWADRLEVHQGEADHALVRGRAAHDDLEAARRRAEAAAVAVSSGAIPAFEVTPERVHDARARLESARAARTSADAAVSAAQSRLDAARRLALDARHLRETDGRTAAGRIREASDAGIPERSRWDKLKDWAGEAWDVVVTIAKVVVAVLGVVALIIGGPLAWVVFAAALVLLADAIMRYLRGECSLWEVALAALGCIPGTKGLTTLAALRAEFAAGGLVGAGVHVLGSARDALGGMVAAVRDLGARTHFTIVDRSGELVDLGLAGASLDDFVGAVDALGNVKAIHATSADAAALEVLMKARYRAVLGVNAERFANGVPEAGIPAEYFRENCTRCVVTTDHALSGSPASAMPLLPGVGGPVTDIASGFGRAWSEYTTYAGITDTLTSVGDGARAIVVGERQTGFSHVFNVVNDHGTVVFIDGQRGSFARLGSYDAVHFMPTHP